MKAAALVPVEEYLRTTYRPDCDYVDGEVLERNVGERDHSLTQREIGFFFRLRQQEWKTFPEQRVQVSPRRFRVPDICVFVGRQPTEQILREPPFICIEIMSPEDTIERMQAKIDDYLNFGVPYVWVINPRTRRAWVYTKDGISEAKDGILRTENPTLTMPLAEIFAGLDIS